METAVEKVEAMFLKSKADLEYIEKRLKLDFINSGAENGCHTQAVSSVEASGQQQPISCGIRQLSDSAFKSVPLSIRSKVKLPELNSFYQQLQEHLCKNNSSLSMQKMKQLKLNMSEAKLKVLQHLTLIEIDKKGSVRLLM
ncbi:spindle and kinetochore-associated protein 2 isoform X3 [Takifugu flavidus]|uniref:spindle and kinetochore-associated protein 2 isoform X3 n=1 Tax=Takifugu flavidus TaxID=433684 RepID=UPI0025443097|nr:spindle and kinetochore-associated protein 2 isoform X3 [Takifugu flavidus]